jgi:hypothetical protein
MTPIDLKTFFLDASRAKLEEGIWFRTCPDPSKIKLTLQGIEIREHRTPMMGTLMIPVIVVIASDGVDETEVLLRLDQI